MILKADNDNKTIAQFKANITIEVPTAMFEPTATLWAFYRQSAESWALFQRMALMWHPYNVVVGTLNKLVGMVPHPECPENRAQQKVGFAARGLARERPAFIRGVIINKAD